MSHPWFEDRAFWVRCLIAGGVGVAGALSQAPFDYAFFIVVIMILGFVIHSGVTRGRQAAVLGLSLGLGYFSVTLSWIIAPFQVDPSTVWMAPFGLFFMALGMALFWAFAFWAATALRARWALIITWTGAELLRAYVFTGFPWGSPPQKPKHT